jgi:hypothetical protein
MKERTRPLVGLLPVWGVVLFFTVYGAAHARDEIASSGLSRWRWLDHTAMSLGKLGDAVGLAHVRDGVENLRAVVNTPYLVLEQPAGEPLVAAAVVKSDAPPDDARSHRVAPAKRRILVVGASSIQYAMGVELERRLPAYEGVTVKRVGKLATGLSRPDLFDWAAQIDVMARQFKPDLVIANFGGNCAQNVPIGEYEEIEFGTDEWDRYYAERVKEIVAVARKHGADMVFAGMPNMRDPAFRARMARLNRAQRHAVEAAGSLWISTWEMTSTRTGQYKKLIEWQGQIGGMRTIDGIHFRTIGASYVVDHLMQAVERHFVLSPTAPDLARAERHTFESRRIGTSVSYVAFIPNAAGVQDRRPLLYVIPGAASRWREWPNYPHRGLQRAAQEHGLVLVVLDADVSPEAIAHEVVKDVEKHLPVSDRRGLLGPDLSDLHATLDRLEVPHTFKDVDGAAFRRSLGELISWHAERLHGPGTGR